QARSPFFEVRDRIVPAFLGQAAEQVLQGDWDAVGFTCTFNQVFPSLALAARLKRARPELVTLLGGACVHGAMGEEYARAFRGIVDHVFLGEADETLPRFLRSLDAGGDPVAIPGITVGGASTGAPASTSDLESLPTPDYDDWFARRAGLAGTGEALPEATALPYESSRGCWWGAKHHCTFCGLNNLGMAFRSKSPGRVGQEIAELAGRHRLLRFMAADNIITHHDFQALVATLAGLEGDYRFFYEIKANLKRDELCDLAAAGVRWVQPGIESFSDGLLGLMRKGTTGLQNVQLLRLCAEFGIHPSYNLLVGFPGERDSDYEEMLSVIDAIGHLIQLVAHDNRAPA
ncbi:MAG: RiPP maturation radical SAM C-methyltransferase, partial [Tistlia sp.]